MGRQKGGVNKSQAVREILTKNPEMKAKEVVAALAEKGIEINTPLYYFIKGQMKGRKGRPKKVHQMEAGVAAPAAHSDALSTILKVKKLADDLGGLKKLRALVEALSE
jgi:hypothetical protein